MDDTRAKPHNAITLSDDHIVQIEKMSSYGLPMKHMAAILGMSERTLEGRAKTDERVACALLKGRAVAADAVYQTAWSLATSGKCPTMTIFWLKCREGWKEDADIDKLRQVMAVTVDNVAMLTELAKTGKVA